MVIEPEYLHICCCVCHLEMLFTGILIRPIVKLHPCNVLTTYILFGKGLKIHYIVRTYLKSIKPLYAAPSFG